MPLAGRLKERVPQTPHMSQEQSTLIQAEIEKMLKKGAISQTEHQAGELLSNIFLVGKRDGGNRPAVNLRYLNQFISYQHFKVEGLFCLRELLQEGDYMCKLDMKDTYFSVPLHQSSRNYVRFSNKSNNLHKIAENTNACTKEDKFLGDMVIMAQTMEEILILKRHCNLSPTTFGFCFKPGEIHFESSSGNRVHWGINKFFVCLYHKRYSYQMSEYSYQKSGDSSQTNISVRSSCFNNSCSFASSNEFSISSATANKKLRATQFCQATVFVNSNSKEELQRWIQNFHSFNGRYLIQPQHFLTIRTDASKKGCGEVCLGIPTGGEWNLQEQQLHINVLKMKVVKLALLAYHKQFQMEASHFQIDNTTALSCLVKMGGKQKQVFNRISQRSLQVSPTPWDSNYCRISSKFDELGRRLAVSKDHSE